jgi:hypothetical protein
MDSLIQDLRYGLRQVLRHRSFSAVVVLTWDWASDWPR